MYKTDLLVMSYHVWRIWIDSFLDPDRSPSDAGAGLFRRLLTLRFELVATTSGARPLPVFDLSHFGWSTNN